MYKNVEIRGYVDGCGDGDFSLYGTSGIRRVIHHDTRRLDFIPAGTIVSCVARPVNFSHVGFELKSIRVSDYKAKRAANTTYFYQPWSYSFQTIEHRLAAFTKKDSHHFNYTFDCRAIKSFDNDLWELFIDLDIDGLREMRKSYTVLQDFKFRADVTAFMSAIDEEIITRSTDIFGGLKEHNQHD